MWIFTSPRTNILLPHYGRSDYRFYDIYERRNRLLTDSIKQAKRAGKNRFVFSGGAVISD